MFSSRGGWINVEGLFVKKGTVFLNPSYWETNGKSDFFFFFFEETKKDQGVLIGVTGRN